MAFFFYSLACLFWTLLWTAQASSAPQAVGSFLEVPQGPATVWALLFGDFNSLALVAAAYFLHFGWSRRPTKLIPVFFSFLAFAVCLGSAQVTLLSRMYGPITVSLYSMASAALATGSLLVLASALYVRSRHVTPMLVLSLYALLQYPAIEAMAEGAEVPYGALLSFLKPLVSVSVFGAMMTHRSLGLALPPKRRVTQLQVIGALLGIGLVAGTHLALNRAGDKDAGSRVVLVAIVLQLVLFIGLYNIAVLRSFTARALQRQRKPGEGRAETSIHQPFQPLQR